MPSNELGRSETPNDDTQANRCNLYIAGIPKHSTEDMLRKAFSPFGSIKSVNIIKDRNTNQQKGFAYIMFSQAKEADEAIEMELVVTIDATESEVDIADMNSLILERFDDDGFSGDSESNFCVCSFCVICL